RRGTVAHAHLRAGLGRALRRPVEHAGGPRHGVAAQAGGARPPADPYVTRPGLRLRRAARSPTGGPMTLVGRVSAFFLGVLALALAGFTAALYALASAHLHRQVDERLEAALATLTATVEIKPEELEWEPEGRRLTLGVGDGVEQGRWVIPGGAGRA